MSGGTVPPREEAMTARIITDADLDRMHERQAAALREVAASRIATPSSDMRTSS
ncbi:hypothetical protein CHAH_22 [Mycobacterium phage Chah]|uniref:Uncharacterized protein n=1 Tax=Mycobacterium phage Chah TaxID=563124 RepID=B5U5S7_9CAUD|nr:hypothetical protein CHAH_22 [Mycobacterium phage Chah]